jgi:hypothetical protein
LLVRLLISLFIAAAVAGCSKTASSDATATSPSPAASVDASAAPDATATSSDADGSPAAAATAVATVAVATSAPAKPTGGNYTDIGGTLAHKQIIELAELGVVDPVNGKFRPHDTLTRGDYVRWLVKANNVYFGTDQQIRLPETTSEQTFVDVPSSNPNYRYIQGLADAGFVVGIDATHFAPNRPITREELLAIYDGRASNGGKYDHVPNLDDSQLGLKDANAISRPYWDAMNWDHWNAGNLRRIFGSIGVLHPQQPATREEAVISISVINNGSADASVPTPTP